MQARRERLKCGIGIITALSFVVSLFVSVNAQAAPQQNQVLSSNGWANEYSWNWADTVQSNLTKLSDNRYERVEWVSNALYVEHYSDSYRFLDSTAIDASTYTPTGASRVIWGGYYAGSRFNFVVTGQSNNSDSNDVAVMRVTKYSKDWNYLDNVEYSNINTYEPFSAGSLRMTETNGELWIRTCHEMYKSSDGYHHQANMTFRIRESDLSKLDSETNVWNFGSPMGYVSHSFNQFIVSTGTKIYAADHGDAYPRAIVAKDITPRSDSWTTGQGYYILNFQGEVGNNYTGSTLSGFETSSNGSSLIAAGTITDQDKAYSSSGSGAKNVWVGIVPTDGSAVSIKYLTNFEFSGNTTATNPVLVKINENRFLILWSTTGVNDATHGPIQYAFIDGQGNIISRIYSMDGQLSDCQPIVTGNNVVWYATGRTMDQWSSSNGAPVFYTIDASNGQSSSHDATRTYTVAFDSNGGSNVEAQNVRLGTTATRPADPTRTGYTFSGWYTARNGGTKYDFNQTVTGDITLYAHWTVNTYTLTFDTNGGSTTETTRKVQYGNPYGTMPTATRKGYTFDGWFTAKTGGSQVSANTIMGAGNTTVYAHWIANTYTAAFDANGGSSVASQKVKYDSRIIQPADPTRTGYTFSGWYTARNGGTKYDFNQTVTGNITLYAHWEVITFRDVNSSTPHSTDIAWITEAGISTGWKEQDGSYTFRGMDTVKRQDMAAFLRRLAARDGITDAEAWKPTENDWARFRDVDRNTPHAEDILWLAHTGISTGYPDGTFRGMEPVYRQDMAAFLHRLALQAGKGDNAASQSFNDVTDITPHASDIRWLGGSGIAQGYPDGTFRGMTPVYRQDMAAFLHRLDTLVTR